MRAMQQLRPNTGRSTRMRIRIVAAGARPLHSAVYEVVDADAFVRRVRDAAIGLPRGPIAAELFVEREGVSLTAHRGEEQFSVVFWRPLAARAEDLARLAWSQATDQGLQKGGSSAHG